MAREVRSGGRCEGSRRLVAHVRRQERPSVPRCSPPPAMTFTYPQLRPGTSTHPIKAVLQLVTRVVVGRFRGPHVKDFMECLSCRCKQMSNRVEHIPTHSRCWHEPTVFRGATAKPAHGMKCCIPALKPSAQPKSPMSITQCTLSKIFGLAQSTPTICRSSTYSFTAAIQSCLSCTRFGVRDFSSANSQMRCSRSRWYF